MDETRRVLRATVPCDDRAHRIAGKVVHVATRGEDYVEVWFLESPLIVDDYLVVGTGHQVSPGWEHVGSAVTPSGAFVWHLFRVTRG